MCDLLKCNAINHPVPWLTSTCTLPWMMLSRHDWLARVRTSPPTYRSQLLLRLLSVLYELIYHDAQFCPACVNLHLHNGNQWTETLLGIAILSAAAERMPDQLWASLCNMSSRNQPIIPPLNSSGGLICNFYENSSGHSICFVITAEGFPEQPNLEWSKGYRCNQQHRVSMR